MSLHTQKEKKNSMKKSKQFACAYIIFRHKRNESEEHEYLITWLVLHLDRMDQM